MATIYTTALGAARRQGVPAVGSICVDKAIGTWRRSLRCATGTCDRHHTPPFDRFYILRDRRGTVTLLQRGC